MNPDDPRLDKIDEAGFVFSDAEFAARDVVEMWFNEGDEATADYQIDIAISKATDAIDLLGEAQSKIPRSVAVSTPPFQR